MVRGILYWRRVVLSANQVLNMISFPYDQEAVLHAAIRANSGIGSWWFQWGTDQGRSWKVWLLMPSDNITSSGPSILIVPVVS